MRLHEGLSRVGYVSCQGRGKCRTTWEITRSVFIPITRTKLLSILAESSHILEILDSILSRLKLPLKSQRIFEWVLSSTQPWKDLTLQKPELTVRIMSLFIFLNRPPFLGEPRTKITTTIGAELCDICVHVQICISLFFSLSIFVYLSLRSDINCLLPNLIRNFRRRDNLTSFLFSLTRSEPLLYGGLVPRIFLSVGRVCERTSERASGHVRLYLFNLYRCVVRT